MEPKTDDNNSSVNNSINAIDDEFWLKYSKDGITKSLASKEKAAARLDTILVSVWAVYTGIFATASLFKLVNSNLCQLIWVSQPIFVIILAKFICTLVLIPSCDDKDIAYLNDVASIIESYKKMISNAKKELRVATYATFISIFSIIFAIIGYNQCDPNKKINEELQTLEKEKEIITAKKEIITLKLDLEKSTYAQKKWNDSINSIKANTINNNSKILKTNKNTSSK